MQKRYGSGGEIALIGGAVMSEEQYFCEYCGYNSTNRERCTHCGQYIADLFDHSPRFTAPRSGKLTLHLHDKTDLEHTWKELAEAWREKVEGTLPHKPSQLEKFNTSADTVELYGLSYMVETLQEAMGARGSVDFQEIPHEQMPQGPKYEPRRPPTVPKSKR